MHAHDSGKRHANLFIFTNISSKCCKYTLHEKENFKIPFLASYILWPDKG